MVAAVADYRLSEAERRELLTVAERMPVYHQDRYSEFIECARLGAKGLGGGFRDWVARTRAAQVGLLRGVPIGGQLPETPRLKGEADDVPMFADGVIGLLAGLFGDVVTFEGKVTTRQIHNIYPASDESFRQLGASAEELDWHVEDAFHSERADWLGILCLRGDPEVRTRIARASDLRMPDADLDRLLREPVELLVDDSFALGLSGQSVVSKTLTRRGVDLEIAFDPPYTIARDRSQAELFGRVILAAERARIEVVVEPGDFLILNNRTTIHGRSAHEPRRDGTDRWIKRALICERQPQRCQSAPGYVAFVPG